MSPAEGALRAASPVVLFGLPFDPVTLAEAVERCRRAARTRRRLLVGVANAAKVVAVRDDEVLREALLACDLLLADGQSVVWAGSVLGRPLPERVAGIDLFEALLGVAEADGFSVYLLGARQEVLDRLVEVVTARHPRLRVAGAHHGYYTAEEEAGVVAAIADSGADLLFLGMTSPRKETFLARHRDALGASVLHGVGGSFDVLAGVTRRAPERWQRLGLEWAYRLLQEPRRLWRRYLTTNSRFLLALARERVRATPAYPTDGGPRG